MDQILPLGVAKGVIEMWSALPVPGRAADHDVEGRRQLADLRLFDRLEIDQDQLPRQRVAQATKHPVPPVLGMAVDEELGRQQFAVALLDLDVNVWRAPAVRDRLDRA